MEFMTSSSTLVTTVAVFGKFRCGIAVLYVFLRGFAVFGPPLNPPQNAKKRQLYTAKLFTIHDKIDSE